MKIIDKWKEWDAKLESKTIAKSKFPGYFNKVIFRTGMALIGLIIILDFCLNGYSFTSVSMDCTFEQGCNNPFYVCTQQDLDFYKTNLNAQKLCLDEAPSFTEGIMVGNESLSKVQRLEKGFHIGRTDILATNGFDIITGIFLFSFLVNAFWYKKKYKSWKYLGKEYHMQPQEVTNDKV